MSKIDEILNFLKFSSNLKNQQRSIKLTDVRYESVADHSFHLALMVLVVEPHLSQGVDLLKTLKMALIHDLVEAEIGDTPYGVTATNLSAKEEKFINEKQEAEKIRQMVGGELGQEIFNLWHEFEIGDSAEAKLVRALDSLEANHQAILYDVSYWGYDFYKIALTKADKHCQHEEILQLLNQEITRRMEDEIGKAGFDVGKIKNGG